MVLNWIKAIAAVVILEVLLQELTGTGLFARLGTWFAEFLSGFAWGVLL
jgi:hypothetical protein